jgi:MFS family permease
MGTHLLLVISSLGVGIALLGLAPTMLVAVAISALTGVANGYVVILFMTWLQERTPKEMMGRTMSVLMLASVGLNPISNACAGMVATISLTGLMVGAGLLMTLEVLLSALHPATRSLEPMQAPD